MSVSILSRLAILASALSSAALLATTAVAAPGDWVIRKDSWSATDERNYSDWITALGESRCGSVDSCLRSSANPYRGTDPSGYKFWGDCAKFPYLLRAYFAWKNGLPFSYVSDVMAAEGASADLRYSPKGNLPTSRRDLVYNGTPLNPVSTLNRLENEVNTAMFRFSPEYDINGKLFFDFVPVKITRNEVKPGTVIYDANGHVAVVYKVETDGRVRFFDAHPDNSVTRGVYGEKFARSNPGMGAGFKNFRPIKLVGASMNAAGELVGGKIVTISNSQNPSYSAEQYYGTHPVAGSWKKGKFVINGAEYDYYDFVRARLAVGELKYKPVEELINGMDALCQDIKDRVPSVQAAINAGISAKSQPDRLPENIYGTHGEWETYSTPSRDARLKTSFRELRTRVEQFVNLYKQGSPRVEYDGTNLVADLREAYERSAQACVIEYKRSDNSTVKLDYNDIAERLFSMSFDPYHCPERRWGARDTSELVTCGDGSTKQRWYEAEQGLRNQLERTYDAKMGFSLDQLSRGGAGTGVAQPPDVDVRRYLNSL